MAKMYAAFLLMSGSLTWIISPGACTALDDYVNKADPSYEFREMKSVRMDNYTVYYINMTSQTWLSCE